MHTLEIPADADRATVYAELLASVRALVDAEPDLVANLANIAAAIKQALPHASWVGFYRKIVEECRESQALYLSFWTELNQEKPRAKEMKAIGEKICKCDEKIKVGYAHIIKDNPTDLKTLLLFGNYLSLLLNNTDDSKKVLQKADNLIIATKSNLQYLEDKRIKYSDCSRLSLITISGNPETLGLIKSINLQALQCLDYSRDELAGASVNQLMPQVYAEHHDR